MSYVLNHPGLLLLLSLAALWLAVRAGMLLGHHRPLASGVRPGFDVIQTAALTLLGLIIGFSFSMALGRYDQRKNYEEAEANAIGTEYARADLLPAEDAARVRALLRDYLDLRIAYYTTRDEPVELLARTGVLQAQLWATVVAPSLARPTPVVSLTVSGMNDVLNAQGYTQAAWLNRIPIAAWALMATLAIFCNGLLGFQLVKAKPGPVLQVLLPALISVAVFLIADIESPRGGLIRVSPQNLLILGQSLRAP
jgi:ABC-type proline/glycine betaine transport system permease subunit